MCDDDRLAVLRLLNGEPHSNSPRQFENQLAVMRRRRRIAQPFSRCFGLARVNAVEGTAESIGHNRDRATPVCTVALRPSASAVWRVRSSGLDQYWSALGNRPASAVAFVLPLSSSGSSTREGRFAHGGGRSVTDENETRGHTVTGFDIHRLREARRHACNHPPPEARCVKAPKSRPSVAHMMSCDPIEAMRNSHSTTAGKYSGTSLTAGSRSEAITTTTI